MTAAHRLAVDSAIKEFWHVLKNNYRCFKNPKLVHAFMVDKRGTFSWAALLTPNDEKTAKELPRDEQCLSFAGHPKVYFTVMYDDAHYSGYLYFYDSHVHVSLLDISQSFVI